MIVTVGGNQYEIDGIPYGTVPTWKMIKQNGTPLTKEQFDNLPDSDKRSLHEHVQQHVKNLQGDC
jgi:hypothetical protein